MRRLLQGVSFFLVYYLIKMKSLKKVENDLDALLNHKMILKASYDESEKGDDSEEIKYKLADLKYSLKYVNEEVQSLRDYIGKLREELSSHEYEGHLPKITSPSQMNKILQILELDGDYEATKKKIYSHSSSAGVDCLIF